MLAIAITLGTFVILIALIWGLIKIIEYLGYIEIRDDDEVPW